MSDPKPYETPHAIPEPLVFRTRASTRRVVVVAAWFMGLFAVALAVFSIYTLIGFDEPAFAILTWFSVSELVVALALAAVAVYWAQYWTKYRVVVGEQFISREGLPHLIDRRRRIAYADILRVTQGTRNVLKIIPKEGAPLAVGLKGLDGEPTALITALRGKLPANRFDANLEVSIFQGSSADRLGYIIGAGSILLGLVSFGGLLLREPILERTAWLRVPGLAEDLRIGQADTADDGSIWLLVNTPSAGGEGEIDLVHAVPDGSVETVSLAAAGALRVALDRARNEGPYPIDSLAMDSKSRPWLILRGDAGAFFWDGATWTRVPARLEGLDFEITDLARAGDYIWARVPDHNALFRIDAESLETMGMGPLSWEYEGETVELRPSDLSGTAGDGAVVFGELSTGRPGYLTITNEGSIGFSTELLGAPDLATWDARLASPDDQGRIHVILTAQEVCIEGRRLIKVGTRLANTDWEWRDLVYQDECAADPMFDEMLIDPRGRVWIQPNDGSVIVFPDPEGATDEPGAAPIAVYSRDNSGYTDGELVVGMNGYILAVRGAVPSVVRLDARGEELPKPLPSWFAWYLEYPFIAQFAVLILLVPFMIALGRRNFRR